MPALAKQSAQTVRPISSVGGDTRRMLAWMAEAILVNARSQGKCAVRCEGENCFQFITDELHYSGGSFDSAMLVWNKPEEHQRDPDLGQRRHASAEYMPGIKPTSGTYSMPCGFLATQGNVSLGHLRRLELRKPVECFGKDRGPRGRVPTMRRQALTCN